VPLYSSSWLYFEPIHIPYFSHNTVLYDSNISKLTLIISYFWSFCTWKFSHCTFDLLVVAALSGTCGLSFSDSELWCTSLSSPLAWSSLLFAAFFTSCESPSTSYGSSIAPELHWISRSATPLYLLLWIWIIVSRTVEANSLAPFVIELKIPTLVQWSSLKDVIKSTA